MRVLALDFDGVLSDSAPESYLTALRTWLDLRPRSRFRSELQQLEAALAGGRLDAARIAGTRLYADFLELMPLGNRAEDYGVVLGVLEAGIAVHDQEAYDEQRAAVAPDFARAFHERFYERREQFAAEQPAAWLALLGPYRPFLELLERRAGDAYLSIATAKDRPSVDRLLASYGVASLFPPERILDKEAGVSKRAHLEALAERTDSPPEAITFVDDKVNHLEDVAGLGVRCALAGWGYNGERERRRARTCGFLVLELASAEAQLFGEARPSG